MSTVRDGAARYADPAMVRDALGLLDELPFPAVWVRSDHQVLWANAMARKRRHQADLGACYSLCYGYDQPCNLNQAQCPKDAAEQTGQASSVLHAGTFGASWDKPAAEVYRIFAVPLSAGGVLELHIPMLGDSTRDPVTKCLNRRAFEQVAGSLFVSAKAAGAACAVLSVDVTELDLLFRTHGGDAREANLQRMGRLVDGLLGTQAVTGQWLSNHFVSVCSADQPVQLAHVTDALKSNLAGEICGTYRAAALIHIGFWQGSVKRTFRELLHDIGESTFRLLETRKQARHT